jgi:uncharacterized protein (DUF1697 family)
MNSESVNRYVALLRGINVGAAKRIAMADLRAVFESLGCADVRTVLQSGNVVFDLADTAQALLGSPPERRTGHAAFARHLEDAIANATGVRASVLVLTAARFRTILQEIPFPDPADLSRMLITFFEAAPTPTIEAGPTDEELAPEKFVVGTDAIYQWLPDGVLETKLPVKYTERFGAPCTARNLRTANRILALLEQ